MGPASANIRMVKENLALSIALWAAAQRGVITAAAVPSKTAFKALTKDFVEVDTPLELTDNRDLVRCVSNQIRGAFAFSAIQTYRSLESTYRGNPLQEEDPDLRAARCAFFIFNQTMTRNLMSPVWICPPEYRDLHEVRDVPFTLDAARLEGKEVYWDDFGGLQPYMGLLEFCCLKVGEDGPDASKYSDATNGYAAKVHTPPSNGRIAKVADVPEFVAARCQIGENAKIIAKDLYLAYIDWCHGRGEQPLAQRSFGMQLTAQGFQRQRRGKGRHWWMGVGLMAR